MNHQSTPRLPLWHILIFAAAACLLAGCASWPKTPPKGVIHQIGFVWLNNAGSAEDRQKIIDAVHGFAREIPEVRSAVVGRTDGIGGPFTDTTYDVSFILTFDSEAARLRYNEHPVHQQAAMDVFLPLSRKLLFYRFVSE